MYSIDFDYDTYVEETTVPDTDDPWDRANTSTDYTFNGTFSAKKDGYADVFMAEAPVLGRQYYAVVAIYSTGDSFGHDQGGCLEWLGLYNTCEEAYKVEHIVNSHSSKDVLKYPDGEGNIVEMSHVPWEGYFEDLDSVQVVPVTCRQVL